MSMDSVEEKVWRYIVANPQHTDEEVGQILDLPESTITQILSRAGTPEKLWRGMTAVSYDASSETSFAPDSWATTDDSFRVYSDGKLFREFEPEAALRMARDIISRFIK